MDEKLLCPYKCDPGENEDNEVCICTAGEADRKLYQWACPMCEAAGPWRSKREDAIRTIRDVTPVTQCGKLCGIDCPSVKLATAEAAVVREQNCNIAMIEAVADYEDALAAATRMSPVDPDSAGGTCADRCDLLGAMQARAEKAEEDNCILLRALDDLRAKPVKEVR